MRSVLLWPALAAAEYVLGSPAWAKGPADPGSGIAAAVAASHESGIPPTPRQSTAAPMLPPGPDAAPSAPEPVRTLTQAITLASTDNPRLASQRASASAADHRVAQARAAYGPTLDVEGSYGLTSDRNDTILGTQSRQSGWASSAAAVLTQPLLTFGRNRAGEAVARAQSDYGAEQLRFVENEVLLTVVTDYVLVIRDANAVSIARQNTAILAKQLDDDGVRFSVREITATDLQQVQNRYAAARAGLAQAEGQLGASQAQFLRDVGAPAGDLAPPDLLELPVTTLDEAYTAADERSPLVAAARARERISRGQADRLRADWLPQVDVRGTAAVGTLTPYTDDRRTRRLQAQVTATIPLLDLARAPRVAEAHDANRADWLLIDQAMRENRASVAVAWNTLASARTSLGWYVTAVDAARAAYEGARIEERAGQRTTLDVLDLARDLLNVQNGYNAALASEYVARANLLSAMGRLDAASLLGGAPAGDRPGRGLIQRGDVPLVTPLLRLLDLPVLSAGDDPRPITDPGLATRVGAALPLPADRPELHIDPTTPDRPPH
ncbi:hypothetical protein GCM10011614_15300 [Novosphingobium colocasiae]|uniref:Type I secretion protein TolC n=1 Tax=Novosphingobium colocasiae TaxID=1256513 RepID=A0A918PDC3_9SPHN|nr:hypothetical protein GCM10011614_15300 [Novosphingobium colocasiae]